MLETTKGDVPFFQILIQVRIPSHKLGRVLKPFLISLCLLWGVIVSLSRISDRRHHWWDVLAGSILGVATATYTAMTLCKRFKFAPQVTRIHKPCASTTTLLDVKNKDATSVII